MTQENRPAAPPPNNTDAPRDGLAEKGADWLAGQSFDLAPSTDTPVVEPGLTAAPQDSGPRGTPPQGEGGDQ